MRTIIFFFSNFYQVSYYGSVGKRKANFNLIDLNLNKRAQRALGRSPEEKVKGHSGAIYRGPQGHNLNNFGRGTLMPHYWHPLEHERNTIFKP